ncbi:zinc finger protein 701-like isoform X2 [Diorhabda carinulata]|nr:zinc finger protein 701-like isoform X2 [Diorhabda carinulata]
MMKLQCDECPSTFSNNRKFIRHKLQHERQRELIKCIMCDIPVQRKDYQYHRIFLHAVEKYKMKCSVCDKYYSRVLHLRKHYAENHEEFGIKKTAICELCGYGTYNNAGLLNHKRIRHNEQKLFLCSACPKLFRTKTLLDYHMPVHTGETPFHCNVCGKKYKHRSGLFYHGKIHKEEYLECPHCYRRFIAKHNLESHKKVCKFVF